MECLDECGKADGEGKVRQIHSSRWLSRAWPKGSKALGSSDFAIYGSKASKQLGTQIGVCNMCTMQTATMHCQAMP